MRSIEAFSNFPRAPRSEGAYWDAINLAESSSSAGAGLLWHAETGTLSMASDQEGPRAVITGDGTAGSGGSLQFEDEFVYIKEGVVTKFLASKIKISDIDECDFVAGITVTDVAGTPPLAAGVTDGVYFRLLDSEGDGKLSCVVERDSTETVEVDTVTLEDDVEYDLAITVYMTSSTLGNAIFMVNGEVVAHIKGVTMPIQSEENLTPSLEWFTANAAADTCHFAGYGAFMHSPGEPL